MTRPPTWIFFDCFNTLVDDFDGAGSETGLEPIAHLPAAAGLYATAGDFLRDYATWRRQRWAGGDWSETPLPQRLWAVLLARAPGRTKDVARVVGKMMAAFGPGYRSLLRPTPGVEAMLQRWQGAVEMGVVSNFYLPGWPAAVLADFGLIGYFRFVLDSTAFGWKKPGTAIYLRALHLAGLSRAQAGEVLFVGDNPAHDVQAPLGMGMQAHYLDRSADRPSSAPAPQGVVSLTHWDQFRLGR